MYRISRAGATFSAKKIQLCVPKALIVEMICTPEGRLPDSAKIDDSEVALAPDSLTDQGIPRTVWNSSDMDSGIL